MPWWEAPVLLAIGCVAGFVNVMAGGGSVLTMPAMVFLGMSGPDANGTNRIALLAQSIAATVSFIRLGVWNGRLSLSLAAFAVPGTLLGAYCGSHLEGIWFNRVLAGVMLGIMAVMVEHHRRKNSHAARKRDAAPQTATDAPNMAPSAADATTPSRGRMAAAHLLMFAAGIYGGAIQAGVGFILIAIMHRVLRLDLIRVNAYKAPIGLACAVAALAVFAAKGHVAWQVGAALAIGNAVGGWLGSICTVRRGER
ncbi:MAG: sulfite exporter TauE/SafE family protein, partial [Pirellulales bacterium]|nr:sulfite exporter TauE/SafE family protein [Pirellulales bacterium]